VVAVSLVGAGLLVIGLAVALGTFIFAFHAISESSPWIAVTPYGAIVAGGAQLARGWRNLRNLPPRPDGLAVARVVSPPG
jgi:hypothetical protein